MIFYEDIEIGSVYRVIYPINTADRAHVITSESCFTVISKDQMKISGVKRYRIGIIYNDLNQILFIFSPIMPFKKMI